MNEKQIILNYLNENLSVEIKRKFNQSEVKELVNCINQLIKDFDDLKNEQNEPDFIKQLKNLQL